MPKEKDLTKLPPIEKKGLAIIMHEQGYSFRTMAIYLGQDFTTLSKWAKEEVPEETMEKVRRLYAREIEEHNRKGLAMVYKRLEERIPEEEDIIPLIRAGEFYRGKPTQTSQTNVQVNFGAVGKKTKEEYGDI